MFSLKKTGWLIYSKGDALTNHSYIEWFQEEASQQNISLMLLLREDLQVGIEQQQPIIKHKQLKLSLPDFAIVRTIEPPINEMLEKLGIPVFNSAFISNLCNNKINTYQAMQSLGVPMTDTYFLGHQNITIDPPLPFPFIIKDAYGRGGENVQLISTEKDWKSQLENLPKSDYIIQSCDVQLGIDIRVFVIGKTIVGAVKRKNNDDFRANIKQGASAEVYTLRSQDQQMIEEIITAYDFGLVGIDFLVDHEENLLFNEIEDVVGSRTLSMTTDINLLEKYITYIKNQLT